MVFCWDLPVIKRSRQPSQRHLVEQILDMPLAIVCCHRALGLGQSQDTHCGTEMPGVWNERRKVVRKNINDGQDLLCVQRLKALHSKWQLTVTRFSNLSHSGNAVGLEEELLQ